MPQKRPTYVMYPTERRVHQSAWGLCVRFSVLTVSLLVWAVSGWAQSPTCQAVAVPPVVRSVGVTERLGDIVLNCTGPANREVKGALTVSLLGVTVTNRISGANLDVIATINNGAGTSILPVT